MQMVMSTTVNGKMTKLMAMEFTVTWMEPSMKDIGKKTSSMVMV